MARAFLALGANIGDPPAQIAEAVGRLTAHPQIELTAHSSIIVTPPWGKTDQPDFHNAVIAVETTLTPEELLDACLDAETEMGRVREEKWGPRLIDIDVIAYDRLEIKTSRLALPHPHAHERDFVLDPLREIAPEVVEWIVGRNS
jgi:2-amino-4-hydroxy-6-hydroxymethyldihydropteridine diphosphokinase